MNTNLNSKLINAGKWSSITEIVARLVIPLSNMILARILSPEAFGVVATITMIISFVEMFSDAGFQKFLVQRNFKSDIEKYKYTTVAFWTNLIISIILWVLIIIYSDLIAQLVGNPSLGIVIVIAGVSLPLSSFSSIQMALYRRDFNFRTLFFVRIVGICIPFIITVPLALLGFSYWSIIIGIICTNVSNAIILTIKSKWKPNFYYDFVLLKKMISFSIWSLIEAISIWLTSWIGVFIVGQSLNTYYLGIYQTSIVTVNGIMGLIISATTPILFSALSRLQNNELEFQKTFFRFQRLVGSIVIPMGIGIFLYRDLITYILLGDQWKEASLFIGLWGLTSALSIVLAHYSSEAYRSKGKPKLSFLAQVLHLVFLVPVLLIAVNYDFETLVVSRSVIRIQFIFVHFILMYYFIKISPWNMLKNLLEPIFAACIMTGAALLLKEISVGTIWSIVSIFICVIVYFLVIILFPKLRKEVFTIAKSFNLVRNNRAEEEKL